MQVRLGEVLIEQGVITRAQADSILTEQRRTGEPFGLLCERLYSVHPAAVEHAWAMQYASLSRTIDPMNESIQEQAIALVTRRQAWQFRILPLRFEGRELMMATTSQHIRRALRFAIGVINVPVYLVLANPEALGEALCRYYPLPGMCPQSINDDQMDRILAC